MPSPCCPSRVLDACQEAENERMHLLTFMYIRQPGLLFRFMVLLAQVGGVQEGWRCAGPSERGVHCSQAGLPFAPSQVSFA